MLALALLAAACGGPGKKTVTDGVKTPVALSVPASLVHFTAAAPAPVAAPTGRYPGATTPTSLDGVRFTDVLRDDLAKPGVTETLTRQGFVVVPTDMRLLTQAYASESYRPYPVFVTADAATNQLHLAFDKVLRTLELDALRPRLLKLLSGLVAASQAQVDAAKSAGAGADVAAAADRVAQLYHVAFAELGGEVPAGLGPLAQAEKALVDAHAGAEVSPLTGISTDYSLYAPRGHYTRSPALRTYFTAMSVLGQAAFCLPGSKACEGVAPARRGILAARALTRDPALVALWKEIYEPTAFLVGVSDDYTPLDVAAAAGPLDDLAALADDAGVRKITDALATARPVRIDPERASIRVMGTRFVVDSFVLDQLLAPNVGTSDKPRLLGSALDVAAAFGSMLAVEALDASGKSDYENYDARLAALRAALAARPEADWSGTVYDTWLHALAPLFAPHGEQYPDFMRTQAWAAKALQTGLGSYTELKHDTLLYSKQALAEGGGDEPPAPRRNWVEPEPVLFGRLTTAATLIRDGLSERTLLNKADAELLVEEIDLFTFLQRIAADELNGSPIAAKDNERLTYIGGSLDSLFWRSADQSGYGAAIDVDGAVVADIESGPEAVLEIGTGRVGQLLVLVPDDAGRFQVAVGGVYSFYEFETAPGERLTDEQWRARLDSGNAPPRPAWADLLQPSAG